MATYMSMCVFFQFSRGNEPEIMQYVMFVYGHDHFMTTNRISGAYQDCQLHGNLSKTATCGLVPTDLYREVAALQR